MISICFSWRQSGYKKEIAAVDHNLETTTRELADATTRYRKYEDRI